MFILVSTGSFFHFHLEDINLASINRQYYGAEKIWLSISGQNYDAFVKYLRYLVIVYHLH